MSSDEKPYSNPFLHKIRRSDGPHQPTEYSIAFFGHNHPSKILEVTDTEIRYFDKNGTENIILLEQCKNNEDSCGSGYVAKRGLLTSPPWIEFFDEKKTRFEFELKKDALFFVWDILAKKGIKTMDMD